MELDPRIKSLPDVLTGFDIEKAKQFLDQKGYFADDLYCFVDLRSCSYGTLANILDDLDNTFQMEEDGIYHSYFFPECFAKPKEKQFRPCTLDNFGFHIGDLIRFRKKGEKKDEWVSILTGYWNHQIEDEVITYIFIGSVQYTFDELFNDYEWFDKDSNAWEVFGVEE